MIGNAIDATLMLGNIGNLIKMVAETVLKEIISYFEGNGFNIERMCKNFVRNIIFDLIDVYKRQVAYTASAAITNIFRRQKDLFNIMSFFGRSLRKPVAQYI